MGKKISTTVYLRKDQVEELQRAHQMSKVPMAEFIRHGVDMALKEFWTNNHLVPPGEGDQDEEQPAPVGDQGGCA